MDAPTERAGWRRPAVWAIAAVALAVVGLGGYLGVAALLPHTSPPPETARTLPQVPGLPPGAVSCPVVYTDVHFPFNAGARGTAATSCAFVEQARREYSRQSSASAGIVQMSVVSPQTGRWYDLACIRDGSYATCTGGAAAVVYLYDTQDG